MSSMSDNPSSREDDSNSKTSPSVNRRKMLALGGGAVAGGLAGCLGDGDGDDPTDTEGATPTPEVETITITQETGSPRVETRTVVNTPEQDPVETTLDRPYGTVPTEVKFGWGGNSGALTNYYMTSLGDMGFDGRYRFEALEDYSLDGKKLTFNLRDDLTYHNGEQVTVDSFLMGQNQLYWVDPEGSSYTREHEKVDDFTARYHYEEAPQSELLEISYFGFTLQYPEPYEVETNEMLRDASSSDERDEILNTRVTNPSDQDTLRHKVENHGGSGPYMIESWDDVTDQEILMTRYDDHPFMDESNPEHLRLNFAGGQSARDQMISNDVTDFGNGGFPRRLRSVAPRHLQTLANFSIPRMSVVHFNYNNKDVGRRGVRRAILSAVDLNNVRSASSDVVSPHTYQLGMTEGLCDNFLSEDFINNRIEYPLAGDTDRAATYMQQAGYSKQNGSWVDPDGEQADITFKANSNDAVVANAVVNPLNSFGLDVQLETRDTNTYQTEVREEFDYDMVLWSPHGCFDNAAHPDCFYRPDKHTNLALGGGASGAQDWINATSLDDLEEGTHYVMQDGQAVSRQSGKPLFPTIPSEQGQERITGDGQEINLLALTNSLQNDEFDPAAFQGAQYFNFDLPAFDLYENTGGAWGDTRGFAWPSQDDTEAWLLPTPVRSVIRKGQVSMNYE